MHDLLEINRAEEEYLQGVPSLGKALDILVDRWVAGARDEETILRLLFLLWYQIVEPPYLTGMTGDYTGPSFEEVFESTGGEAGASPLVLWTVGKMAELFPWAIGEESRWQEAATRLLDRARQLQPRIEASDFSDLGAAGDYFRHLLGHR